MIGIVDVEVQAANPQMPLCPFVAFVGSPSSVRVRNVPGNIGRWDITKVYVSANYPDNSIQSRECTRVGEIYVGTLPACDTAGKGANGFVVSADGVDENGNAVTGYVLGKGDLEILDADGAITPGVTTHYVHGLDEQPSDPHEYDIYKDGDTWKIYFNGAWGPLAPAPVTLDNAVTRTSENGVKSSGIWSAIWGALTALPTGFTSLYDWCVSQLAGKVGKTGDTMTGGLTVPNFTVGSRKSNSTVGINSTTEGYHTEASGFCSHAEGTNTEASGAGSHAEGYNATAQNDVEHAQGRFNVSHKASTTFGDAGNTLSSAGFGTADNARKNAVETMQDGKTYIYGLGGYDGTNPTNATDLAAVVNAKASRAASPTAGNLAALDASGNPTDSTIPAANVAVRGNIPYSLGTPTIIDTAFSETVEGETVYYGAATLADRTANVVQVTAATALDELRITFPAATSGKVRDFGLRVEIGTGSAALTAPALVPIAPTGETIKIENADGTIPELADGTATAKGVTLLYFSETAPGVFVVKGEQVEEVA